MIERGFSERILDQLSELYGDEPCVYLIQCGGLTRIGFSGNLTRRIVGLRSMRYPAGCLGLGRIEKVYEIKTSNPRALESDLHILMDKERVSGEWFHLKEGDLDIIRELCSDLTDNAEGKVVVKERKEIRIVPRLDNFPPCKFSNGETLKPYGENYLRSRFCNILSERGDGLFCEHHNSSDDNCPVVMGESKDSSTPDFGPVRTW